jgi:hypothetical protein
VRLPCMGGGGQREAKTGGGLQARGQTRDFTSASLGGGGGGFASQPTVRSAFRTKSAEFVVYRNHTTRSNPPPLSSCHVPFFLLLLPPLRPPIAKAHGVLLIELAYVYGLSSLRLRPRASPAAVPCDVAARGGAGDL